MANVTVNLSVTKSGYIKQANPTTVFPTNSGTVYLCNRSGPDNDGRVLIFGFQQLSSSLKNRRLYNVRFLIQHSGWWASAKPCTSDFNPSTLCWDNAPAYVSGYGVSLSDESYSSAISDKWLAPMSISETSLLASQFLKYCTCYVDSSPEANFKTVLSGGGAPYFEITYDSSVNVKSKITPRSGPTSGYSNPRNATTFSWEFERDSTETYYCAGDFTQSSASLKWKTSGASSWNTVNASGSTKSLTVAANTFPTASTIEWYLTGTDTAGTSSESAHYTFSTAAGTASAIPVSPINSVEDGSKKIILRWTLTSTDGQAPIYVDLQRKIPSASSWTSIWNKHDAVSSCTCSVGLFPAGENQWRVRAYNVDDVAGPWSSVNGNPPSFICVAAPNAPTGLQATAVPRTTINWQSTGQEACEIEIDGTSILKQYSPSANQYKLSKPLSDGDHVIRVRIQGVYGLWSDWTEITVSIVNDPPNVLTLSGRFDVDAELLVDISTHPDDPYVHWYRDGVRIAETHGPVSFTDRTALGEHSWFAEMWFSSGYYSRSNIITGTLKSCETRIADIAYGSSWLTLNLSENSNRTQNFSWSRASNLSHVRGSAFPVLEMGESEDLTGSYECAFKDVQTARKLEALKGKVVIVKSRGGQILIGALTKLTKRMKEFYITYSFSIQQIQWEDFVNYDQTN